MQSDDNDPAMMFHDRTGTTTDTIVQGLHRADVCLRTRADPRAQCRVGVRQPSRLRRLRGQRQQAPDSRPSCQEAAAVVGFACSVGRRQLTESLSVAFWTDAAFQLNLGLRRHAMDKWIIKPQGNNQITITLPTGVEWNPNLAEIDPKALLRALAAYVEAQEGGKWFDCGCNIKL